MEAQSNPQVNHLRYEVFTFGLDLHEYGQIPRPPTGWARPAHTLETSHAIALDVSAETPGTPALVAAHESRAAAPSPNVNTDPAET